MSLQGVASPSCSRHKCADYDIERYYPVSEANRPHQLDETGESRDGVLVGESEADV